MEDPSQENLIPTKSLQEPVRGVLKTRETIVIQACSIKMQDKTKIILVILGTILFALLLVGFLLMISSTQKCSAQCNEKGTDFYDVIYNRNFIPDDMCICYFEDKTMRFRV